MRKYNIIIEPSATLSRKIVGIRMSSKEKQMLQELRAKSGCKNNSEFLRQVVLQMHKQEFFENLPMINKGDL